MIIALTKPMQSADFQPQDKIVEPGTTHRRLAYAFILLAVVWLAAVSTILLSLNKTDEGPVERPWQTGYELIDGIIRHFWSVAKSGFSPWEFVAIEYWSLYLTVFLASLGAIGGLLKVYQGISRAPTQKDFSAERRDNLLLLVCASVSATILGSSAVLASVRKKYLLQKFYSLEVHLVRFEGLMFSSLSISARRDLLDTFFTYMLGYFNRIQRLMRDISYAYDFTDEKEINDTMQQFAASVKTLKAEGFTGQKEERDDIVLGEVKVDNTLLDLLQSLEFLQEAVRRHIRGLER